MHEPLLLIAQAVKSGVPLASAIRLTVGERPERANAKLLRLAELLYKGIEPKIAAAQAGLPKSVVDLLDAALSSDDFAGTFDELTKLESRRTMTIHRVLHALTYPMILFVSSVFLLFSILWTTVPQFEEMFDDFYIELPPMTELLVQVSQMSRSPLFLLGIVVFTVTLWLCIKFLFPRFWLCVPVLGHIGRCLYTARMLRQMASHVSRNVPLPEALEQCGKTMRNSAYRHDCNSAADAARKGMSFSEIVLRYYWLFPSWLSPMVAMDNARESLTKSLRRAAETVEQQQDSSVLLLQVVSLPLFIIIMSTAISFLVLALFAPMIAMIEALS